MTRPPRCPCHFIHEWMNSRSEIWEGEGEAVCLCDSCTVFSYNTEQQWAELQAHVRGMHTFAFICFCSPPYRARSGGLAAANVPTLRRRTWETPTKEKKQLPVKARPSFCKVDRLLSENSAGRDALTDVVSWRLSIYSNPHSVIDSAEKITLRLNRCAKTCPRANGI